MATNSESSLAPVGPTPGDWLVSKSLGSPGTVSVYGEFGRTVAVVSAEPEQDSNAVLIAASPKMLAALKGAQEALRKALPFLPADSEALFVGEWLGEVDEAIVNATRR